MLSHFSLICQRRIYSTRLLKQKIIVRPFCKIPKKFEVIESIKTENGDENAIDKPRPYTYYPEAFEKINNPIVMQKIEK